MPIFEKEGKRLYFAHIPKTAGISTYCAFADGGWKITGVTVRRNPHTASEILRKKHGVIVPPSTTRKTCYPHSVQHSPHFVWRNWGRFDESFAILRNPLHRFLSTIRYRAAYIGSPTGSLITDALSVVKDVKLRPWRKYTAYDGHLIPQRKFLGPGTVLFKFEENWESQIASRYALPRSTFPKENVLSCSGFPVPPRSVVEWVTAAYAEDFSLWSVL